VTLYLIVLRYYYGRTPSGSAQTVRKALAHTSQLIRRGGLSGLRGVVRHRYSDRAARRRKMAMALYCLTDVELRDMGMNHGDIPTMSAGAIGGAERKGVWLLRRSSASRPRTFPCIVQ
jgi:hypothetical protein